MGVQTTIIAISSYFAFHPLKRHLVVCFCLIVLKKIILIKMVYALHKHLENREVERNSSQSLLSKNNHS